MANPPDQRPNARGSSSVAQHEERQLLRRLQRAEEQLARKDRELEQFIHSVAHDLKSPLVTIVGFIDLLAQDLQAGRSEQNLEVLGRIRRAGMHMSQQIEDLLELSKLGGRPLNRTAVQVPELVRELLAESSGKTPEAHGVRVDVQAPMPIAYADRQALAQVLDHLLANAAKHGCRASGSGSGSGSGDVVIEVGGCAVDDEHRYFVRDHGPGIASEHQQRIFAPFQVLEGGEDAGAGLGLATVSRIMAAHGGRVWVESKRGTGATFWISLPQATEPGQEC